MNLEKEEALTYLQSVMPGNKAVGLLAQLDFEKWISGQGDSVRNKYFPGCWIVSLKKPDFYALKTCFFVAPTIKRNADVEMFVRDLQFNRQFHALNSSLRASGFEVMHCIAVVDREPATIGSITWRMFRYHKEQLVEQDNPKYFSHWEGRGRPSNPKPWKAETLEKLKRMSESDTTSLVLPQLFFNGFFKTVYKASVVDPYDTDGFIVSYDGKVFPVELKEKYPFYGKSPPKDSPDGKPSYDSYAEELADMRIGVDVGRVLMMLRICIPSGTNGYYIVREVEKTDERKFKEWKYIRLDEILMKCYWNVQAGGPGMASSASGAGTSTSTIIIPYLSFLQLNAEAFSDDTLRKHASMFESSKKMAVDFAARVRQEFGLP